MKPNVIIDFDGVIHSYKSGWHGAATIKDEPIEGMKEEIARIREKYRVVVVSTRCYSIGGINAINDWLKKHEITVDDVTGSKPPAVVTIDDRAICFNGNPSGLLEQIQQFQVWNKKKTEPVIDNTEENLKMIDKWTGKKVRHFKNKEYVVIGSAWHTENEEYVVIYKALYDEQRVYVRPLHMFLSEVDKEKYPDVTQKYRMELVGE